jgi:hypothetical protein
MIVRPGEQTPRYMQLPQLINLNDNIESASKSIRMEVFVLVNKNLRILKSPPSGVDKERQLWSVHLLLLAHITILLIQARKKKMKWAFQDPLSHWSHQSHTSKVTSFVSSFEPFKVENALQDVDWVVAMQEELDNFKRNQVWYLVERPKQNVVTTKWVFCNKQDEYGVITRNKERLVAKGYLQVKGLDFKETFAPVARIESIRILLAYATHHDFKLYQIDVKNTFLNGHIKKEVYVEQPPDFEDKEYPNHVYKLHKSLYGLKQAPRAWYQCLRDFLT